MSSRHASHRSLIRQAVAAVCLGFAVTSTAFAADGKAEISKQQYEARQTKWLWSSSGNDSPVHGGVMPAKRGSSQIPLPPVASRGGWGSRCIRRREGQGRIWVLLDLAENRRPYSKIDVDERRKIARWRIAGICVEAIAGKVRFMGRSLQLIS